MRLKSDQNGIERISKLPLANARGLLKSDQNGIESIFYTSLLFF